MLHVYNAYHMRQKTVIGIVFVACVVCCCMLLVCRWYASGVLVVCIGVMVSGTFWYAIGMLWCASGMSLM
jgi:hypothetical protein